MSQAWPGLGALAGGKAYVVAPLGQLHFRDIGPRCQEKAGTGFLKRRSKKLLRIWAKHCLDLGPRSQRFFGSFFQKRTRLLLNSQDQEPPFLLLHQSPQFMIEFAAVQNVLAARGVRSVAVDTPGYGMSDQPPGAPGVADLADNLLPLLDLLGVARVIVAGHHTGACIAAALAARHPDRVCGVILHGCPVYSAEEAARFRHAKPWALGELVPDGAHLLQIFARIPPRDPGEILIRTWMSAGLLLQGSDGGHLAVNDYDMAADLLAIVSPGMIMTEADDVTHGMDQRARALRPDFLYRVLGERGTSAVMTDPGAWANLAMEFRQGL